MCKNMTPCVSAYVSANVLKLPLIRVISRFDEASQASLIQTIEIRNALNVFPMWEETWGNYRIQKGTDRKNSIAITFICNVVISLS